MNNVTLIGRLTRDPELRYVQSGTAVARFSIAIDKPLSRERKQEMESQNQQTADFINIVVWGRMAENCSRFTAKGKRVGITGRIQTGSYLDNDGKRVYTTEVVANNVEFLDWKDQNDQNSQSYGYDNYNQGPGNMDFDQSKSGQGNSSNDDFFGDDFEPIDGDERIPF